ncbi:MULTISPECIES: hypothetical protein [unclassified Streptomyces]|uniref:hypothetical protein n=1 Tax=unclassified Streptomyces TaxID=2593676 RepID=UPI0035DC212D
MPDALYQRYLDAVTAYQDHRATCTQCSFVHRCPEGQHRWTAFEQRQDAYLARQRSQREPR